MTAEAVKAGKDAAKEDEKEIKKQTRSLEATAIRAGQIRALISKHFGELSQMKLTVVELDVDEDAAVEKPRYSNVTIRMLTGDGTDLKIEVDDAVQIDGVWNFQGRIDDELTIKLPDED